MFISFNLKNLHNVSSNSLGCFTISILHKKRFFFLKWCFGSFNSRHSSTSCVFQLPSAPKTLTFLTPFPWKASGSFDAASLTSLCFKRSLSSDLWNGGRQTYLVAARKLSLSVARPSAVTTELFPRTYNLKLLRHRLLMSRDAVGTVLGGNIDRLVESCWCVFPCVFHSRPNSTWIITSAD